ncbi:TspO/MBR-related protein [Amanita rubescens]|nr:TspO/MBR-related protein [Amanita rubescens]
MPEQIYLPTILLSIPRNPVTAVGLPVALSFVRGAFIRDNVKGSWFQKLCAPSGRLPTEVFPVVWPIFYMSLGYVSHLTVKALDSPGNRWNASLGLAVYYLHLGLNLSCSPIFFRAKKTGFAFANSAIMTSTALYMMKLLDGPTGHEATFCLLPYCTWLAYMTYLNGALWWLNISRGGLTEDEDEDI